MSDSHHASAEAGRLTLAAIRAAEARIRGSIHRTPVLTSATLDEFARARLFLKCEHLQKGGAFKARGATNAVFSLAEDVARRGVVTHSSGNHAAALARAARLRGVPAYVVMPRGALAVKRDAAVRYGGELIECEPTLAAREATAAQVLERTGATLVHPYDDLRVMAGQGTTALELLDDLPDLDAILCPVGGGGQLSGIAVAAKSLKPSIRIVGVEPAAADDAARSLAAGRILPAGDPRTIADGLRTTLGTRPFAEIRAHVDAIVTVEEASIVAAMRLLWSVTKAVVEPSGAVAFAAVLEGRHAPFGERLAIVLSGGNFDPAAFDWSGRSLA